jgi:hypothetical protein
VPLFFATPTRQVAIFAIFVGAFALGLYSSISVFILAGVRPIRSSNIRPYLMGQDLDGKSLPGIRSLYCVFRLSGEFFIGYVDAYKIYKLYAKTENLII